MLLLYNTLTRKKEKFKPLKPPQVGLYTCGPTVYNYPHIGNYRAYLLADILKRYLRYSDYHVKHVMNITDVDDKTIRDSNLAHQGLKEFTSFYTKEFFKDLKSLNIEPANIFPKATDHVGQMIEMIQKLLEKGIAYPGDDGSIYFNIKKFKNYGELSGLERRNLKSGASGRIKKDEYQKENAEDFALWKSYDPADRDVFWNSPFGRGRPGWHIECSAMSQEYLGQSFDLHTGGIDLIFPHHENERAQSEGVTNKPFVKYWLHNEWLLVDGQKMSKSAGNFYTLEDLQKKDFSPLAFRYLTLQTHYRKSLNFTWDSLEAARKALESLSKHFQEILGQINKKGVTEKSATPLKDYVKKFKNVMDNDLNTPEALALAWKMIKDPKLSLNNKKKILLLFDRVLGLGLDKIKPFKVPIKIKKLVTERERARRDGDYKKSDAIRDEIMKLGFIIKDTPAGQEISF